MSVYSDNLQHFGSRVILNYLAQTRKDIFGNHRLHSVENILFRGAEMKNITLSIWTSSNPQFECPSALPTELIGKFPLATARAMGS